jgi:hypothetical protein
MTLNSVYSFWKCPKSLENIVMLLSGIRMTNKQRNKIRTTIWTPSISVVDAFKDLVCVNCVHWAREKRENKRKTLLMDVLTVWSLTPSLTESAFVQIYFFMQIRLLPFFLRAFDCSCRTCAMLSIHFHLLYWFNNNEETKSNKRISFNYFLVSLLYNKSIVRKEENNVRCRNWTRGVNLLTEKYFSWSFCLLFAWHSLDRVTTKCSSQKRRHHATRRDATLILSNSHIFKNSVWNVDQLIRKILSRVKLTMKVGLTRTTKLSVEYLSTEVNPPHWLVVWQSDRLRCQRPSECMCATFYGIFLFKVPPTPSSSALSLTFRPCHCITETREGQKSWLADCSLYIVHRICEREIQFLGGWGKSLLSIIHVRSFVVEGEEGEKIICQTTS